MDSAVFDAVTAVFGGDVTVTLYPMAQATAGPNAARRADTARAILSGVPVIRSENAVRVVTGDNGMGRSAGTWRQGVAERRHVVSIKAGLAWEPLVGDELVYSDRPDLRYRLTEPQPDGGAGLHFVLARV